MIFENAIEQSDKKVNKFQDVLVKGNITVNIISNDKFEVYIKDLDYLPEGTQVKFPTWTTHASGIETLHRDDSQDDLQENWVVNPEVVGENLGDGVWKYTGYRADHFNEYGDYIVDIYKNSSGAINYLGGIRFTWEER